MPKKHKNDQLTTISKKLRTQSTKEERKIWYDFLKLLPYTFNRQKVFDNYIVDFYCAEFKLVIEIDGAQHFETDGRKADIIRDKYFSDLGITVVRYSNLDINRNFNGVCLDILSKMNLKESEVKFRQR